VQGEIQSDGAVSEAETLLGGSGSEVDYGSLTAIPIDGGLVYVRPFYVSSTDTKIPNLRKVIVYFEGDVAIENTLQEALIAVFGESPNTARESRALRYCCGAASRLGWRLRSVICLIRAESEGLQVATSGSSLKALWTSRRS